MQRQPVGLGFLLMVAVLSGCAMSPSKPSGASALKERDLVAAEAQVKREQTTQQLKSMPLMQLAKQLAADSERGREPFNSMAFSEALTRRDSAKELDRALAVSDRSSLLGLLALRRIAPELYREKDRPFRIAVFVDALKNSRYFNAFGLPHLKWEEAAQALIDEGEPAIRTLMPLLTDERPAPVWGSEDYLEYRRYDYRVQDYAFALISEIRKEPWAPPVDRQQRLRAIERLR